MKLLDIQHSPSRWHTILKDLLRQTGTSQETLGLEIGLSKATVNGLIRGNKTIHWSFFVEMIRFFLNKPGGLMSWQAVHEWVQTWCEAQNIAADMTNVFLLAEIFPEVPQRLLVWTERQLQAGATLLDIVALLRAVPHDLKISPVALQCVLEMLNGCPDSETQGDTNALEQLLRDIKTVVSDTNQKLTKALGHFSSSTIFEPIMASISARWRIENVWSPRYDPLVKSISNRQETLIGSLAIMTSLASLTAKLYLPLDPSIVILALLLPVLVDYLLQKSATRTTSRELIG